MEIPMNTVTTSMMDYKKISTFIESMKEGQISYSIKETGSGGDVRYWGIDKNNDLVRDLTAFFTSVAETQNIDVEKITVMYNIIPVGEGLNSGDGWHFDSPLRQMKCFCYLTDVESPDDGAIQFLRFRNCILKFLYRLIIIVVYAVNRHNRISNSLLNLLMSLSGEAEYIFGEAGFCFVEDTSYPHKGGERLMKPRHAITLYYFDEDPEWLGDRLMEG